MKNSNILLVISCLIASLLCNCTKDNLSISVTPSPSNSLQPLVYTSMSTTIMGSKVNTWIEYDQDRTPLIIAIKIPVKMIEPLPIYKSTIYGKHALQIFYVELPTSKYNNQLFNHAMIVYSPSGFSPGVFQFPHMSFNFYINGKEEAQYYNGDISGHIASRLPQGFEPVSPVKSFGEIWVPTNSSINKECYISHEISAGVLSNQLAFYGPLASIEFLKSHPAISQPIPLPQEYSRSGYYPTQYSINQVGEEIHISLEKFVFHP